MLAILLALALSADSYYLWPLKDPKPPISSVDSLPVHEKGNQPSCLAANEDCEEP